MIDICAGFSQAVTDNQPVPVVVSFSSIPPLSLTASGKLNVNLFTSEHAHCDASLTTVSLTLYMSILRP